MDHLQATRISSPYQRDTEELMQLMEHMTKNADTLQQQVLTDILARNAHTEYLQHYKLDGQTDRQNFKQKLPLATYEDLQPYIQRIANGDRSPILSAHPISDFFTSSGTSGGERKLIPNIEEEWDRRALFYCIIWSTMKTFVPGLDNGKGLYFLFVKSETKTAGGLPARPALTGYYKSNQFRNARQYDLYTSPDEAIHCLDASQSMYAQMLCGLSQNKQVLRLGAVFASGLLRAIRFLELHWKELAHDISTATLNPKITDPSIRGSVSELLLEPNPELATFIINECSEGSWEGIIRRIWPNAKYMDSIVTGAMAPYIPALQYYSSGLPLASTLYASSECYFAINPYPLCEPSEISYTLVPNMAYFEFLPHPHQGEPVSPVDLADVEPGKEYELVVTTFAGLYRYKVGDILKVVGFHNSAPRIQFIKRKNVLLSIDADKTDEVELHKAVVTASELLHEFEMSVVDYTSYADTKTIPGHYVVFWELLAKNPGKEEPGPRDFENCCLAMEEALNSVYRQGRVENQSIGPLEIRIVESGTFQELMEQAISKGASIDQYKVPRCVNSTHILELLDSRVLSSYVSPACPHWMPAPQF